MYTEIVMDHLMNPRNVGTLENANGLGEAGDPACGDFLKLEILVQADYKDGVKIKKEYIADIKYMVHGCAGAIATSSMVSELVKGKHVIEAYKLTDNDVIEALGGLPSEKIHCSLLGIQALRKAIIDFAEKDQAKD